MLYFSIELFVDALVLLLHANTAKVQRAIRQLIDVYNEETKEASYKENEFFDFFIHLIQEIMDLGITINNQNELDTFVLKFKSNPLLNKDPEMYTTLKGIFTDKEPMSPERVEYNLRKITNCLLYYNNAKYVKKMFGKLSNINNVATVEKQDRMLAELNALCNDVIQMNQEGSKEEDDENRTKFLNFDDKESIAKSLKVFQKTSVTNVFKTGLQGLNRSLGETQGFRLGESVVFNALSHHGKSLSLLKMARWAVTLNKVTEDFKNPTCVIYSLENETSQNLMQLFEEMWVNEFKELPPKDISEEQIINYCFDSFRKQGWHLIVERRLGGEFGFAEFVATFEEYKRNGFTVLMCIVDYLNMMRGVRNANNDAQMGNHLVVRELYTNMCNYLKANNCTFVTAHQLNRKAAEIVRQNPMGAVKRFTVDCLADGMDPQREVDCAFYQHIETNQLGNRFLTFHIDKHRYVHDTRDSDKYFAYKFTELGILDDIEGPDMSFSNIYAEKVPTDGEQDKTGDTDLNLFGE